MRPSLRRNLRILHGPLEFPMLEELRQDGFTDYLALVHRFGTDRAIGEMDCIYSYLVHRCRRPVSRADQLDTLDRSCRPWPWRSRRPRLRRIADTLVETYLGRDAGRLVLSGPHRPRRGREDPRRAHGSPTCAVHAHHRHLPARGR